MNLVEESTVIFRLDGKPFISSLSEIEMKLVEAKDKMALLEKGTKEWADAKKDVKELEAAVKDARTQMDLSQLTVKQLTDLQRDMVKVMKESKVGSEEYIAAAKKLEEINPIMTGVRRDMRGIGEEATGMTKIWGQFKEDFTRAFSVVSVFEAGRAIAGFVQESVVEFRKFQSAGADLSAVTGLVGKDLEFLKEQAKITGPAVGMMGSDMLEAYKMMASAKPELLAQKELLAETTTRAITLAQAAKIELAPATDLLASSLNQFGRPAQDAAKYINIIAAGAKEGSAEISDMAGALKNSGTVAAASKVSFEQTNAVLQSLSTIALKGGEAGTQLKNVLLTLSAGSDETNPKIVGLDKAIENLGKQKMSTAEIAKMFGKENVVAAQHIIAHGTEIKELTKKLTGTEEAFSQAAKNTATMDFQMKQAAATTSVLKTEIGAGLEPILVKIIAGFITFVNVIRAVPSFLKENKEMITALGIALLAFNGHLIIATASSLAHAAGERAATIAKTASTTAQWLLNTALTANPIGAVVAVIALLVGGLVTWYNNSETVRGVVNGLWESLKVGIEFFGKIINSVISFVQESSLIQGVISVVSGHVQLLMNILSSGWDMLNKVFGYVKNGMAPLAASINSIIALAQKAIGVFTGLLSAITPDIFKEAGTKIGKAFSDGYAVKMDEARKTQEAAHKKHVDKKVTDSKAGATKIGKDDTDEHAKTLTAKEKAAAKAQAKAIADNAKKAKKEAADTLKEENSMQKDIEKLKIAAIKSEEARTIATLKFKNNEQLKQVAESKASEETKAAYVKALNEQLARDISATETKHRDEKVAADKKAANEIQQDQETKRKFRQAMAFDTEKAIVENALMNQNATQAEIQRLTLQRLAAERAATFAKLDAELAKDKATLQEAYNAEVEKARKSGQDTTEIHDRFTADQKAIDDKYRAESTLANTKYQNDKNKEEEDFKKKQDEGNKKFYQGLKSLMDGDFQAFTDGLAAKFNLDTKHLSQRKQKTVEFTNDTQEIANVAFDMFRQMNDKKLELDINNLTKEKNEQLAAWKEKYDKGLISKEDYDAKSDQLNKEYAEKEQKIRKESFERQKKADIASALIQGALGVVKSLAMFGWPFGLIAAAGMAIVTGIQVAAIASRTFAQKGAVIRNAGVVKGAAHGSKYGESGIQLIDRQSGMEVGEMEGGEPIMILSKNTYANNKPVVDKLLDSSLHKNGAPIYKSGGLLGQKMYSDGGTYDDSIRKQVEEKRERERQQSEEAKQQEQVQANANVTAADGNSPADNNGVGDTSSQQAAITENTKLQKDIARATIETVEELKRLNTMTNFTRLAVNNMNDNMGRFLGSIEHNTRVTADRTGDIGYLASVLQSKFK